MLIGSIARFEDQAQKTSRNQKSPPRDTSEDGLYCAVICRFSLVGLFVTPWTRQVPVHGILQARILEWVAIFSFRGSSPPRD